MFIKIGKRYGARGMLLVMQLTESHRVNGEPSQKALGYLGSSYANDLYNPFAQLKFWRHAQSAFNRIGLTNEQKYDVDKLLTEHVGKPSDWYIQQADKVEAQRLFAEHETLQKKTHDNAVKFGKVAPNAMGVSREEFDRLNREADEMMRGIAKLSSKLASIV